MLLDVICLNCMSLYRPVLHIWYVPELHICYMPELHVCYIYVVKVCNASVVVLACLVGKLQCRSL